MSYPQYHEDMYRLYQSEVYGAATFAAAARFSRDADKKAKWTQLMLLEEQTKLRVLKFMADKGLSVRHPYGWALRGKLEGLAMSLAPWRWVMEQLLKATADYYRIFTRMREHAAPEDQAFFDYIVRHEEAIQAFARSELAGAGDSLAATRALLS